MSTKALGDVQSALARHGFAISDATFGGRTVVVGRTSEFRWRWMASRLHTFVVAADFGTETLDLTMLDHFLDTASRYATANKGGLPSGLQTGTATVALTLTDGTFDVASQWAARAHGRRYGAMAYPVAADTTTGEVVHPGPVVIGALFNSYLKSIADDIIAPAIALPR